MLREFPHLTLWRLVLQAETPLSIGTGRGDGLSDVVLARDANGLPLLPASALAGVLRAAHAAGFGEPAASKLFGFAEGQRGQTSRLEMSHGHIHDSQDKPVLGLDPRGEGDPLLGPLLQRRPTLRQRVRIDHRGTADGDGLFDRSVLPAGHRFSVELMVWSAQAKDPAVGHIEALLAAGALRVGGLTRSGLGHLGVPRGWSMTLDLREPKDLERFARLDRQVDACNAMAKLVLPPNTSTGAGTAALVVALTPEAGFRFGGGHRSFQSPKPAKRPDDLPASEARVVWDAAGRGKLEDERPLIAGTALKGPLAHRTAFHANRLEGCWAERWNTRAGADPAAPEKYDKALHSETVRRLFGWAPDHRRGGDEFAGQAGVLWWSDLTLDPATLKAQTQWHNSVDRFTGGVRDGALFTGENLYAAARQSPLITLRLVLDLRRAALVGVDAGDLQALEQAVEDLCQGRLALGADGAGGQGFFSGKWSWAAGQRPSMVAAAVKAVNEEA